MKAAVRRQAPIFWAALMFYTRLPCPANTPYDAATMQQATRYFPVIGWIVGIVAALVFLGSLSLVGLLPAVVLSLIASVLVTGAFHEDGFADACDGFGGGWQRDDILRIMKDSRIGVYGALGLTLIVLLKITLLFELFSINKHWIWCVVVLVSAHALSRYTAVLCIRFGRYARANGDGFAPADSKAKPLATAIASGDFYWATGFAALPWIILLCSQGSGTLLLIPVLLGLLAWRALRYFERWVEGYTGDCLGAVQQVAEILVYLMILMACRF